jgi:hypothetical protein
MKEALRSSETSVLTRTMLRNIPEDTILQLIDSSFKECYGHLQSNAITELHNKHVRFKVFTAVTMKNTF